MVYRATGIPNKFHLFQIKNLDDVEDDKHRLMFFGNDLGGGPEPHPYSIIIHFL